MSTFDTTDPDAITAALAAVIVSIIPRYAARRDQRYTYTQDQEVAGTLRNFDLVVLPQVELIGWYSGGVEYAVQTEIVVSYPLSAPHQRRFAGADGEDLSAILIRLHTTVDGLFAARTDGTNPITEIITNGIAGAFVTSFFTELRYFASDQVQVAI